MLLRNFMRPVALAVLAIAASGAQAIGVTDATGDYLSTYTGSRLGDLDVVGSFVTYNSASDKFVFSGTMNGDIGSSAGGFYVWGIDRGAGTARFAANGLPGVLFDAVVIFNADGSGAVRELQPGGSVHTLAAGSAARVGSTIIGQIDGSWLPSLGTAKTAYTWNLWPRDGTVTGFGQFADFAPNAVNLPVTNVGVVPEPGSMLMLAAGLAGLAVLKRRRLR